jgi:hypothetical protein
MKSNTLQDVISFLGGAILQVKAEKAKELEQKAADLQTCLIEEMGLGNDSRGMPIMPTSKTNLGPKAQEKFDEIRAWVKTP